MFIFYRSEVGSLQLSTGVPPFGSPRLLIRCTDSHSSYLEAASFIRNPRPFHAVVTMYPVNMYRAWNNELKSIWKEDAEASFEALP
jgi:hypothetical protein